MIRTSLVVMGAAVLFALTAVPALAWGPVWQATFPAPVDQQAWGDAVAAGPGGVTYVAANTSMMLSDASDGTIVKYDAAGVQLWAHALTEQGISQAGLSGIAVTASGDVVAWGAVGVMHDTQWFVCKYGADGAFKWSTKFSNASRAASWPEDAVVDAAGNVYLAGVLTGRATGPDAAVAKVSADGALKWKRTWSSAHARAEYDWFTGIALDGDGNVYCSGLRTGRNYDWLVAKYSNGGALRWVRGFHPAADKADMALDIAVSKRGRVFVAGSVSTSRRGNDAALRIYTAAGSFRLERWLSAGPNDDQYGIVKLDPSGKIVCAGVANEGGKTGGDTLVAKYTASGITVFTDVWDSGVNLSDMVTAVLCDPTGRVFACGTTLTSNGGDFLVLPFEPYGLRGDPLIWDAGTLAYEEAWGAALLPTGPVLTGSNGATSTGALTVALPTPPTATPSPAPAR